MLMVRLTYRDYLHLVLGGGNSIIFYFHPYLGRWTSLTNIFQRGWNHQLVFLYSSLLKENMKPYQIFFGFMTSLGQKNMGNWGLIRYNPSYISMYNGKWRGPPLLDIHVNVHHLRLQKPQTEQNNLASIALP